MEHCRGLQRGEYQHPQQLRNNLCGSGFPASLVRGHPQYAGALALDVFVPFTVISCKALVLPLRFGNFVLQPNLGSN